MGYTIPGADFTTPAQLKTNVGAETGKMLGNVFASLGPAFIAQQKELSASKVISDLLLSNMSLPEMHNPQEVKRPAFV